MNIAKLIAFLKSHMIEVLSNTEDTITVKGVYSKGGAAFTKIEHIPATASGVRDWLGY